MTDPTATLNDAIGLHQRGDLAQAEALYGQVLALLPRNVTARHMLGVLRAQQGRNDEALAEIGAALAIEPDHAGALVHQGNVLSVMGRFDEALGVYDRALAKTAHDAGARNNRGSALLNLGRADEALADFDQALAREPHHRDALFNRGNALRVLGRRDAALQAYASVLARDPGHVEALYNSGNVQWEMGRSSDALASFASVLTQAPRHAGALNNRGAVLWAAGQRDAALASYAQALAAQPDFTAALNNMGNALTSLRRFEEALGFYERALVSEPANPAALDGRAGLLLRLKRYPQALAAYQAIMMHAPDHPYALGGALTASLNLCDWGETARLMPLAREGLEHGTAIIPPFMLLGASGDKALQLRAAKRAAKDFISDATPLWSGERYTHDRIRIAYLSSDYGQHPVPALLARLIESHDRSRFEIHGVSTGLDDNSAVRARIVQAFDQFHDLQAQNAHAVAQKLRDLEVDILIELNGHTDGNHFAVLACRPCPVQVNYLGYPGTSGSEFLDYVLADPTVAPFADQVFFSEKIVHLPDCYFPTSYDPVEPPPTRLQAGLPPDALVFCSFNNSWKITAEMFALWMRLLKTVPGSVLWLLETNADLRARLAGRAQEHGVDAARLIYAGRTTPQIHLARQSLADVMLDTVPYNGHMTSSDALWAGVPLVTMPGTAFAGRVAASLLRAAGVPELVAHDLQAYEGLALKLAQAPALRKDLREKLARNRATAPLFDAQRLCRAVEATYARMHARHQNGAAPQSFAVP